MEYQCPFCGEVTNVANKSALDAWLKMHVCEDAQVPYDNQPNQPQDEWEEQSAQFTLFTTPGEEITGVLKEIDEVTIGTAKVKRASVETEEGMKSFLLTTSLEPLIMTIEAGTMVKVRYMGTVTSRAGRTVKQFKVFSKRKVS